MRIQIKNQKLCNNCNHLIRSLQISCHQRQISCRFFDISCSFHEEFLASLSECISQSECVCSACSRLFTISCYVLVTRLMILTLLTESQQVELLHRPQLGPSSANASCIDFSKTFLQQFLRSITISPGRMVP